MIFRSDMFKDSMALVEAGHAILSLSPLISIFHPKKVVASNFLGRIIMGLFDLFKGKKISRQSVNFNLRDTGPAGGLIFYVNPNAERDGWKYLECAPKSTEWENKEWSKAGIKVGTTDTVIGAGKTNTVKISKASAKSDSAAHLCASLSCNGRNDWFLPSKDELNQMYINLKLNGVGELVDGIYWASTEDMAHARIQNYKDGRQGSSGKDSTFAVRAVRAF